MKTKQLKHLVMVMVITTLLQSCKDNHHTNDDSGTHEIAVSIATVSEETVSLPVKGSGLLSSDTEATLSFKIGGVIHKIYVEEGESVRKGQVLARLNLTEINAKVTQARKAHDKAKRDLKRVNSLYKDDAATLEQVQDLTTLLDITRQDLQIAIFNQNYAEIRAISDGTIVRKMMNEGELVNPGTPILFMNDTTEDEWKLEIGVSDKDWARLQKGDVASIHIDAYPDKTFEGKIIRLAQGADPTNGSYAIEIKVNPKGVKFATGMFASAAIKTQTASSYMIIPIEALVDANGNNGFVFVLDGSSKVKKIPVDIAFMDKERIAISKGIHNGDNVVTSGSGFLNEFVSVKVLN
ncbi:efflux RND transporter periplasmic adaptor subunit [uncultured Aquimarina sp.]|uniref:efflux RND transporter periplasmic adaptor subunit n=1 Tax=uncultured Aquimarina sp. TaxID=575652 RepID=UPI002611C84F|nr:efflux RND transporter periplasmic adaptor subunit [uncultured Aquimarina sp.]